MNKVVLIFFGILVVSLAYSQDARKGFIGLNLGANIPMGDFGSKSLNNDASGLAKTGMQLNLINFGYLFTDKVGITATWYGSANALDTSGLAIELDPWSYGGIMVGPLFRTSASETVDFDLKPMIGYCVATEPLFFDQSTSIAFSLGGMFLFKVSEKVGLTLGADYFATRATFDNSNIEQSIANISLTGGFAFLLR